jgi:membrane-bound lytic murein transglycosylase A
MLPKLIDADLEAIAFSAIDHWSLDDHQAAFLSFLKSAKAELAQKPHLRPARWRDSRLLPIYQEALDHFANNGDARVFFEANFTPFKVQPHQGRGFLTGYYEPEILGSLEKTEQFPIPVLARPDDLVTFPQDEPFPLASYSAARQTEHGFEPYFDRAAIWDGALDGLGLELVYLPDKVELFFAHIQGSARVRLPDGKICRLTYAGRNGHAYTTIAKVILAEGHMALSDIHLESLKAWLRANPAQAERLMRLNQSYIFFSRSDDVLEIEGPIGAASTSLDAGRSIAIDRRQWSYGLPFFISANLPDRQGQTVAFSRLMIAQGTGSAILGAARADLFMGSGEAAGRQAGLIRHAGDCVVLLPRS